MHNTKCKQSMITGHDQHNMHMIINTTRAKFLLIKCNGTYKLTDSRLIKSNRTLQGFRVRTGESVNVRCNVRCREGVVVVTMMKSE